MQVPSYEMYWGWNALGNWVRVSVVADKAGTYDASLYSTCNSNGTISVLVTGEDGKSKEYKDIFIPSTGGYHEWAVNPNLFSIDIDKAGPYVLTVNITDSGNKGQLGNIMWADFVLAGRRNLRSM